ncbi:MAG: hypothetical protein AAF264_03940 [Pseudomonadota bacterium]
MPRPSARGAVLAGALTLLAGSASAEETRVCWFASAGAADAAPENFRAELGMPDALGRMELRFRGRVERLRLFRRPLGYVGPSRFRSVTERDFVVLSIGEDNQAGLLEYRDDALVALHRGECEGVE